jgi:hypothetical protein
MTSKKLGKGDLKHYETAPIEELRAELAEHGINPQPAIDAVKKTVATELRKPRRSLPRPV